MIVIVDQIEIINDFIINIVVITMITETRIPKLFNLNSKCDCSQE